MSATQFDDNWSDYTLDEVADTTILVPFTFDTTTIQALANYDIYFYGKYKPTDSDTATVFTCSTISTTVTIIDAPSGKVQATVANTATQPLALKNAPTKLYTEWKIKLKAGGTLQSVLGGRGVINIHGTVIGSL